MIWLSPEQRETLVHEQVRGFAQSGWIPRATASNHGVNWRWYRDGTDYVIAGVVISEHPAQALGRTVH